MVLTGKWLLVGVGSVFREFVGSCRPLCADHLRVATRAYAHSWSLPVGQKLCRPLPTRTRPEAIDLVPRDALTFPRLGSGFCPFSFVKSCLGRRMPSLSARTRFVGSATTVPQPVTLRECFFERLVLYLGTQSHPPRSTQPERASMRGPVWKRCLNPGDRNGYTQCSHRRR
jgi:hypothetical protein